MEEPLKAPEVCILLSTYNGAKYLSEQVESIRRQTFSNWTLLVRDDGSSDETVAMVQRLRKVDRRVVLMQDTRGNLGAAPSFGVLLERAMTSGASYVALCDQDDVWQPDKLARELAVIRRREREVGETTPLLVHSDLSVVAQDLSVIHHSYLTFQGLRHQSRGCLARLLVQNFVTGCTTVINGALLRVAVPVPNVIMHDWWLALCAAALGEVLYLPEPTVLYRQHGENVLGSQGRRAALAESLRRPFTWWRRSGLLLDQAISQAGELKNRVERETKPGAGPSHSLLLLWEVTSAFSVGSALTRLRTMTRYGIRPRTFLPYPIRFYLQVMLRNRPYTTTAATHPYGAEGRIPEGWASGVNSTGRGK